jgi:hypothetical protein
MADGFLSRWARRKEAVRQGKDLPEEPAKAVVQEPPSPQPSPASGRGSPEGAGGGAPAPETAPAPTLEDVQALTAESDFSRFVQPDVSPEVKNAAMKKLFSDPHFNVMDGLDTYIDDYSKPDPMPPEMLKSLASAKFLRLFEEKDEGEGKAPTDRENADDPLPQSVAQSSSRPEQALPPAEDHADPDLRLQQDDAPGPEGPGAGSR